MKDLKQIRVIDSIGKKVSKVEANPDEVLFVFEDGTFSFFQRYQDFDGDIIGDFPISIQGFVDRLLLDMNDEPILSGTLKMFVDAGIVNFQELCLLAKDKIDATIGARKDAELKQLRKLQDKYGVA